MKKLLYLNLLVFSILIINGCTYNSDSSFENQYRILEKETEDYTSKDYYEENKKAVDDKRFMTEGDRFAAVQIEAQQERRAANKVVASNYFFEVYPDKKGTYSYNQYNEVWSDAYPKNAYKETKRLWEKPKKIAPADYTGIPDDGAVTEEAIAAAEEAASNTEQSAAGDSDSYYE